MKFEDRRKRLNIYINSKDKYKGRPLSEAILKRFYDMEVSGCTVLHSAASYGLNFNIHKGKTLKLGKDHGIIVQVVETERKINEILPVLEELIPNGLITLEDVYMIRYSYNPVTEEDRELADDATSTSLGDVFPDQEESIGGE